MSATQVHADQRLGFQSLAEELAIDSLPVQGSLPEWLSGDLVRVTPAGLDVGGRSVRHWFDGLAMLHKFSIHGDRVAYANRFLDTEARRRAGRPDARQPRGFDTDPCRLLFKRVVSMFSPVPSDNANVNLVRFGDEYLAMTETPMPVAFDLATLATVGTGETAPGQVTTAHPHFDPGAGELLNYTAQMGRRSTYNVYARRSGQQHRLVGKVPVAEPGYMHSFAMTAHYVVLAEFPLVVNPLELLLGRRSFIESYRWLPERATRFLVVDRATGELRAEVHGEPFFAFHHVNAFEDEDSLVVDVCAYPDPAIIDALSLGRLRAGDPVPRTELRRYRIPLTGGDAVGEALSAEPLELPRIAYSRSNARPYRHAYGVSQRSDASAWFDRLVGVDVTSGQARSWSEEGCFPGEPVFAGRPGSDAEADGVLLSVVLDAGRERSFLLVLDAASFTELARAEAPHAITFGFHGQFWPARASS